MSKYHRAFAASLMALAAVPALHAEARADCLLSVGSDGAANTCIGTDALYFNDTGSSNTAIGSQALGSNRAGNANTAIGALSLTFNEGNNNVASGQLAGAKQTGSNNTWIGAWAGFEGELFDPERPNGSNNIALGYQAGAKLTGGEYNIAIGNAGMAADSKTIRIGTAGAQTRAFMAGIRGVSVTGGQPVVIDASGQLGTGPGVPVVPGTGSLNTALGNSALSANTSGSLNTAGGVFSLMSNTEGNLNTASGVMALAYNERGSSNTASGSVALFFNRNGNNNTASGSLAGGKQTGSNNTTLGAEAGWRGEFEDNILLTGSNNIALGYQAGSQWTSGSNNIAIGTAGVAADANTIRIGTPGTQTAAFIAGILGNNIAGGQAVVIDADGRLGVGPAPSGSLVPVIPGANNTSVGAGALSNNQVGGAGNTASGAFALEMNASGANNTASGHNALNKNSTGGANTASGVAALQNNTTGNNNTASGLNALLANTTGGNNTAMGTGAMAANTTGSSNTALGFGAGSAWTTGANNIAIGNAGVAGESNTIRIGTSQTRTFIAGIRGIRVTKTQAVLVDANGQIGTSRSSIRYKEDVHTMGDASNPLMNLRPVTFRYKEAESDGSKPIQYGLIAEEVEKVMPDLVIYNAQGTPESVAYETLPSLLLNEYQKQGRKLADAETYLVANRSELVETKAKLAAAEHKLGASEARLESIESELAALKHAVSRLAAAPAAVKLAGSQP